VTGVEISVGRAGSATEKVVVDFWRGRIIYITRLPIRSRTVGKLVELAKKSGSRIKIRVCGV
jgi:hypothetical protein